MDWLERLGNLSADEVAAIAGMAALLVAVATLWFMVRSARTPGSRRAPGRVRRSRRMKPQDRT